MAKSEARTKSDAAPALEGEYDVFLNFRGQDTRHNFTDFLYNRLVDAGVHVFRDEEKLRIGQMIGENLLYAINNCKLYVPIFSRTYASSKWCLRELALMVHNVSNSGGQKSILPIFFDVEPEDVKLKTPLYKADFERHKMEFPDEVEAWRTALEEVDKFKGWNVKKDQSQAAIVKLVVEKASEKLKIKQKLVTEHLVGLDDRVKALIELLDVNHGVARLIGIYGMGGIGKTTIAKVIFNELSSHFGNCCSFLEGVRERLIKEGIVQLQKKLLYDIVGSGSVEKIDDSEEGMRRIEEILRDKKVFVVLDDVNERDHIKKLIGNSKLDSRSRIIITTRDIDVLKVEGFKGETRQYEMLEMDVDPALELFGRHAFSGDFPSDDYRRLSSDIVSSTGGLPLAIEVIGSLLNGKDREIWEETLDRLRKVPEQKILEKLRISYDDLEEHHKQIFLDIACFFVDKNKTDAIYMWTDCQFYPKGGLKVLIERCLVKILDNDKFWMHDQLIALGRQIGKQSRLQIEEEALRIVRAQQRKDEVQALEIDGLDGSIEITNEDFERLPNLRFLKLRYGTYAGDFASCCSNLRWFSWDCPWDFMADKLSLDHLVVCKLNWIYFKDDSKAWDLIKMTRNLKVLSFIWCNGITKIPDISKCSSLERLTLQCSSLERIESFIGNLQLLIELKIEGCRDFTDLPEEIGALVKLKHFSLGGCSSLRELPGSIGNLTSLIELDLSDTGIRELPNSIGKLKSLRILRFPVISSIGSQQLPSGICTLVNLEELDLSWHYEMKGEIPVEIGELSSLRILNLEKTRICGIPKTINKLHHLQTLNLSYCHEIQELPELPTSLTRLHLESRSLLSVPNLSNLTNLVELLLSDRSCSTSESNLLTGCNVRWIGRLSKLKMLDLHLLKVPAPPELSSLSRLEELTLSSLDLETLVQLPSSLLKLNLEYFRIKRAELLPSLRLRNLSTLGFYYGEVEDIPLHGLPLLEILKVWSCKRLKRLSIPLELTKLRDVLVINCPELVEILVMGLSKSLELLSVDDCISITRIRGLSYLTNLEKLRIKDCYILTHVEGLDELESLKSLEVWRCPSFRSLIDASCTKIQDDCVVNITCCGDSIKDSRWEMSLKRYREEILLKTSNKIKHPFTIKFILGIKKNSEDGFAGGIKRKKANVNPGSVTYEGLIADVKSFSFRLKRIWYIALREDCVSLIEVKSDEQVNGMVLKACKRGFICLYVEGEFENEPSNVECSKATTNRRQMRDGRIEHDSSVHGWKTTSMINRKKDNDMIGELANQNDIHRSSCQRGEGVEHYERSCKAITQVEDQRSLSYDGVEFDMSGFDEVSYPACVGESETDGTSSIFNYFRPKPGNAECFEVMRNRRQMRDGRIGHYGRVEGGKTASMENRKKDKDEIEKLASPSDAAASSRQTCEGVEHNKRSCKVTTEVEDPRDVSISESGNVECFEATRTIAEKDLHSVQKYMEFRGEPKDDESVRDVTVSTISSNSLADDRFFEAKTVSEASRWSAEVDELERLLNAYV
ncbi:disease resistance protein L6-like isoform X2 [Syzygium oleosum]|uniref:disease resistance protein L6-like isoform X2 n=1 Tax=Syzygium oleosum TaxID=219896 RepID=UPI0024BB436D|nr:disease resistance protein L6-like isoform X2 [Syzygium oleosum]